jgi:hypothetical protein
LNPLELFLSELPPEQVLKITSEPQAWAEALLIEPKTARRFTCNYVQEQILNSPNRHNVIRVHRRAGKSYSMAILALFYCLMYQNCQVLLICPRGAQVKEIFLTVKDFIRANPWLEAYIATTQSAMPMQIGFTNGSRFSGFTTGAAGRGKATSLRGQGGDVILIDEGAYLHEDDWTAINPIIQGDEHRRWPPKVYIASTPAHTRGHYYELCVKPENKRYKDGTTFWREIHVSILENPSVSDQFREECRSLCATELDWIREYLCEFPEQGEGVFPKKMVDAARVDFSYDTAIVKAAAEREKRALDPEWRPASRTIGVDWDKYNADGRGPNIIVLETNDAGRQRVIYRQEIPQTQFTLKAAVNRIVELNELFKPEWIFVDRGYGDMQLEELHLIGKRDRGSGLDTKVVGVSFANVVEQPMPGGGPPEKKRFKQVMIQLLRAWLERGILEIPYADDVIYRELIEYHTVGQTEVNLKFCGVNDHAIAALGLAAMAMHTKVKNPYTPPPAARSHLLKAPEPQPAGEREYEAMVRKHGMIAQVLLPAPEDARESFGRRALGNAAPFSRSTF